MLSRVGRRGYQARYTREQVLAAALEMLDEQPGLPLTIKGLADRLAIAPMTLYGYVADKDELLEGVAALVFERVGADIPADAPWQQQLKRQAQAIHAIVVRHPGLAPALRAHKSPNPSLFRVRERMLAVLDSAGFTPTAALRAMGIITAYAQGFAAVQSAGLDPAELPERVRRLPADEFPLLHRVADIYASHISDSSFERGLDLLLEGLRSELTGE
jgi:AcrR family transcriptional regulator